MAETITPRLRNRVRELRKQRGETVTELAKRAGLERHVVGEIDQDKGHEPSFRTARKLATALETSVETLFWTESDEAVEMAS